MIHCPNCNWFGYPEDLKAANNTICTDALFCPDCDKNDDDLQVLTTRGAIHAVISRIEDDLIKSDGEIPKHVFKSLARLRELCVDEEEELPFMLHRQAS